MHNLSCKNEFYLHENEKSFPYQRLSTYPRFEAEAGGELGNGLLNLFQELESVIHWPDGYTMLIGLSPWTCWYSIFWWSLIRYKDAHGSRDRCLPHYPPQCLRVCAEQLWGRDCCLPTPGWYGFAHALETGQAMGWCTCANSCYVCYNATRYFLTFSSNWMVPSK